MGRIIAFLLFFLCGVAFAENGASWIWFPGDFENFVYAKFSSKITFRGEMSAGASKISGHYPFVCFFKEVDLKKPERIKIFAQGKYTIGENYSRFDSRGANEITIPAGRYTLKVEVFNYEKIPALYIEGETVFTDKSWRVKIDEAVAETEAAERAKGLAVVHAATDYGFDNPARPPADIELPKKEVAPKSVEKLPNGFFADFGRETFGNVKLAGLRGKGDLTIYYGESPAEANSDDGYEVIGRYFVDSQNPQEFTAPDAQGFRYVRVVLGGTLAADSVKMDYEFADIPERGSFECSDPLVNEIWRVSYYTLLLTTREFYVDGVKRDRWVWAGDAAQSYLMDFYSHFELPTARRTLWANRGKEPDLRHLNRIMDYSFYWLDSVRNYYLYTGDAAFVRDIYPRMKTLAEFCLSRTDKDGFAAARAGDWIFVDWADMPKDGVLCVEQILFARALAATAECAEIAGEKSDAEKYSKLSAQLLEKTLKVFWDEEKGVLRHGVENGKFHEVRTRYAAMFAALFGYLDSDRLEKVKRTTLLNDSVLKITTPYMRFYELAALCEIGRHDYVLDEIRSYWGGMLKEGATSFWEVYDPSESGAQHTAMYGRPFGRSFCHSWGASPLYLLGRYFAGVKPTSAGYATYEIAPAVSTLGWFKSEVPTPFGKIKISATREKLEIDSDGGQGKLKLRSAEKPRCENLTFTQTAPDTYEAAIAPKTHYKISYRAKADSGK